MKIKRLLIVAAVAGAAVAAYMQKQQQDPAANPENIWKPVDPLRPFGEREEDQ